jgi:hypothetical protein
MAQQVLIKNNSRKITQYSWRKLKIKREMHFPFKFSLIFKTASIEKYSFELCWRKFHRWKFCRSKFLSVKILVSQNSVGDNSVGQNSCWSNLFRSNVPEPIVTNIKLRKKVENQNVQTFVKALNLKFRIFGIYTNFHFPVKFHCRLMYFETVFYCLLVF